LLWDLNPRPSGLVPWASAFDHSSKWLFSSKIFSSFLNIPQHSSTFFILPQHEIHVHPRSGSEYRSGSESGSGSGSWFRLNHSMIEWVNNWITE
jgi:hypothetical protein